MTTGFDAPTTAIDDIAGDYALDVTHSRLGFVARHAMVTKVRGQFGAFTGTANIDEATPADSKVDLSIDVTSIETGNADRDGHLKSGDFFDAETYPTITFASTDVKRDGDDWTITGDLTIKDVTKSVTIQFEQTGSAVTRSATPASASRARPPSTARTGASPGTPRSRPAASSSPRRSSSSSTSRPSRAPDRVGARVPRHTVEPALVSRSGARAPARRISETFAPTREVLGVLSGTSHSGRLR